MQIKKKFGHYTFIWKDLYEFNCLNGWTAGIFVNMLNDYLDNLRHNMTKNLQNSKFYFFESDLKTDKKHL